MASRLAPLSGVVLIAVLALFFAPSPVLVDRGVRAWAAPDSKHPSPKPSPPPPPPTASATPRPTPPPPPPTPTPVPTAPSATATPLPATAATASPAPASDSGPTAATGPKSADAQVQAAATALHPEAADLGGGAQDPADTSPVSYTHLTLPTKAKV